MLSPFLILVAVIIFLSVFLNNASSRLGVPVLLAFIMLGMGFAYFGLSPMNGYDYETVQQLCSGALIFIMFYGGFGTSWKTAKPIIREASILATAGVALTAVFTGLFCHFVLRWELVESLLMGSVVASTDAATVFSILRGKKLGLKNNSAPLLEVESGSNDPMSYLLTIVMLSLLGGGTSGWEVVKILAEQILIGVACGLMISTLSIWAIRKVGIDSSGFASLFFLAVALVSYAIPDVMGGNGYLSAYIVGIFLGNKPYQGKKELVPFFDGVTSLMQVLIFFTLGLLVHPRGIANELLPALFIFIFMLFMARPLTVGLILIPFRKYSFKQRMLVSFSGLRGASSIVFAIVATVNPAMLTHDIFNIVFGIVLLSISLQGWLLPSVARRLGQTDEDDDVMRTFSDFSEETDLQFSEIMIENDNPWLGKQVSELGLPRKILLCRIKRPGDVSIIPKGNTVIEEGDRVMMCTMAYKGNGRVRLIEDRVSKGNKNIGLKVKDMSFSDKEQLVLIRRDDSDVIPYGGTVIKEGDILIVNKG